MNKPPFIPFDPQAVDVNFPNVARLPAHSGKEAHSLDVVEEDGSRLRSTTSCNPRSDTHSGPVEAPLLDGLPICRGRRVGESAHRKDSPYIIWGLVPLLELAVPVPRCHPNRVFDVQLYV